MIETILHWLLRQRQSHRTNGMDSKVAKSVGNEKLLEARAVCCAWCLRVRAIVYSMFSFTGGSRTNEINFHFEQTKKKASDLIVLRSLFAIKISRLRSQVQITLLSCAAEIHTFYRFHRSGEAVCVSTMWVCVCVFEVQILELNENETHSPIHSTHSEILLRCAPVLVRLTKMVAVAVVVLCVFGIYLCRKSLGNYNMPSG